MNELTKYYLASTDVVPSNICATHLACEIELTMHPSLNEANSIVPIFVT